MNKVYSAHYDKMEVKRETYEQIADNVVTTQPTQHTDMEKYVIELDVEQVITWTPEDVVNNFLTKINCGYANELFSANKINGRSLMLLTEDHLKEMGIHVIGDRVYMLQLISLLKKKKKEMETSSTLWSGEMPAGDYKYSEDCWHCIRRYLCPFCVSRTYWKVTGQGVFYRKVPPCNKCFGTVATEYMDFRFFKDLELKQEHLCCCFCRRYALELYVNDQSSEAEAGGFPEPRVLLHPDAPKAEKIIRNAWSGARLVAD